MAYNSTAERDQLHEFDTVLRSELRFAVKAWRVWAPRAMAEKDIEIDALRQELGRLRTERLTWRRRFRQANDAKKVMRREREAARLRLVARPRRNGARLKVAGGRA
jgi:hypothetical protein